MIKSRITHIDEKPHRHDDKMIKLQQRKKNDLVRTMDLEEGLDQRMINARSIFHHRRLDIYILKCYIMGWGEIHIEMKCIYCL